MDLGAMLIGFTITFCIKVIVTVFSIRLLYRVTGATGLTRPKRLWYLLPKDDVPEITLLGWSLMAFFASEVFCGVETWIILQSNLWTRLFHALASAVGMGLFAVAIYRFLDKRVIHYEDPPCVMTRVCHGCPKARGEECTFHRTSLIGASFLLLAPLLLFLAPTDTIVGDTRRFILPFPAVNAWYDQTLIPFVKAHYSGYKPVDVAVFLPHAAQVFEFKVLPALSMLLTAVGIRHMRRRETEKLGISIVVFSAGLLAYCYFELCCYRVSGDLFLGALAHELAEFWFLLLVAEFLRRSFPAAADETQGEPSPGAPVRGATRLDEGERA